MVIEQSTIIGFYIASVAQIMMIALSLFFLHRKHPFRMTAIVVGIAVYFLASQLLTSICYSALTSIAAVQSFLSNPDHIIIYYLILAVLTALFMAPVAISFSNLSAEGIGTSMRRWLPVFPTGFITVSHPP